MSNLDESSQARVDQIADEYETAWQNGDTSRIAQWVARARVESTRTVIELLKTDVQLREANGETPTPAEYVARLGGENGTVDAAFSEMRASDVDFDPTASTVVGDPLVLVDSPANDPLVGARLDDFLLSERIGRGGMGVVYRARQLAPERRVAVKVIRSGELAGPEEVRRFIEESNAVAALEHPGIVRVIKCGVANNRHYYAMEFVEGKTLEDLVKERDLGDHEVAQIVADLAEAIQYAHEAGIVHRDLKPANVMIDKEGKPRILDFGLALRTDIERSTTMAKVEGSAPYMSPEQAVGSNEVDHRTDVYGLGAILYVLLTRRKPFTGRSVFEILHKVQERAPLPPRDTKEPGEPPVHRDLEQVCLRCLHKEPEDRYSSAGDLADDLRRFQENRPVKGGGWWRILRSLFERHWHTSEIFATRYTALVLGVIALVMHTAVWGTTLVWPDDWWVWTAVFLVGWTALFVATVVMYGRRYWESDYIERMTGMSWIGHWLAHLSVYALVFFGRPLTLEVLLKEVYPLLTVTCAALAFSHGAHEGRTIWMGFYWFGLSWLMLLVPTVSPLLLGFSTFGSLVAVWLMLALPEHGVRPVNVDETPVIESV